MARLPRATGVWVRLAVGSLALGLCLLGCGSLFDQPVRLATGVGELGGMENACITYYNVGVLIADPETGTAAQGDFGIVPLIWPLRYTARRLAGGEIEVLNGNGELVATTGKTYAFWTGSWGGSGGPPGASVPSVRRSPVETGGPGCVKEWHASALSRRTMYRFERANNDVAGCSANIFPLSPSEDPGGLCGSGRS